MRAPGRLEYRCENEDPEILTSQRHHSIRRKNKPRSEWFIQSVEVRSNFGEDLVSVLRRSPHQNLNGISGI